MSSAAAPHSPDDESYGIFVEPFWLFLTSDQTYSRDRALVPPSLRSLGLMLRDQSKEPTSTSRYQQKILIMNEQPYEAQLLCAPANGTCRGYDIAFREA